MCVDACVHTTARVGKPENNSVKLELSFHPYTGYRKGLRLNHLSSPLRQPFIIFLACLRFDYNQSHEVRGRVSYCTIMMVFKKCQIFRTAWILSAWFRGASHVFAGLWCQKQQQPCSGSLQGEVWPIMAMHSTVVTGTASSLPSMGTIQAQRESKHSRAHNQVTDSSQAT